MPKKTKDHIINFSLSLFPKNFIAPYSPSPPYPPNYPSSGRTRTLTKLNKYIHKPDRDLPRSTKMRGGGHGPVCEKAFNFKDLKEASQLPLNTFVNTLLLAFFEALTRCSHLAFQAIRQALSRFKISPYRPIYQPL